MTKQIIEAEFTFIRGGLASKTNRPYLQVSNGIEALFITIPKTASVDAETFADYEEGDIINLKVSILPGSPTVTLVDFVE